MDSGTLALWLVGALWALFALWVWASSKSLEHVREIQRILLAADKQNVAYLNKLDDRVAGVEALLVSTVGQETEDFCRQMDALMEKMDEAKPEPKKKPEQSEKLTLSQEYCGKFGKKGKK